MNWWKKFPWKRLLALLIIAAALIFATTGVQGEKMYVKVASSNPDAVLMSGTDFFDAEPVGTLLQNQEVNTTGKEDGQFVEIEATVDGKKVKGWVKSIILNKKPLENVPRVNESGAVDNASFAAPGFDKEIESGMRSGSPEMKQALERLDAFEAKRAALLGIKNWDKDDGSTDSTEALRHYREFGKAGGLK
jgi:hypothetical protein